MSLIRNVADPAVVCCDKCERNFLSKKNFRLHFQCIHCAKSDQNYAYSCFDCPSHGRKTFKKRSELYWHYRCIHLPNKMKNTARCFECNRHYTSKRALHAHFCSDHWQVHRATCFECRQRFQNKPILKAHIIARHLSRSRPAIECFNCCRKFRRKSGLIKHHSILQAIICFECGAPSESPQHLMKHLSSTTSHSRSDFDGAMMKCFACNLAVKTKLALSRHIRWNHYKLKEDFYRCEKCALNFSTKKRQESHHERVHLKLKLASCDQCPMLFYGPNEVRHHKKRFHSAGSTPCVRCYECHKGFSNFQMLTLHQLTHHPKLLTCDECGENFNAKNSLWIHGLAKIRGLRRENTCKICQKSFSTLSNLMKHRREMHEYDSSLNSHHCSNCQRSFKAACYLKRHFKTVHLKIRPHQCQICQKLFSRNSHLNSHLLVHNNERIGENGKSFRCDECTQTFNHKTALKDHLLQHNDAFSAHRCDECTYSTHIAKNFKLHKRKHENDVRRYKCTICEKQFSSLSSLSLHQKLHSGNRKRYSCYNCKIEVKSIFWLRKHSLICRSSRQSSERSVTEGPCGA